ncbi:oligopeptide-binding protein [Renibacterium salmoninarum ATCC 33209]|uniref:Oligopeptide-binding protein n=1 Tax=Renibacterium salmoninarum (strain ATCC 33209 / DSM 20767 / JCM 11484 / NBRC 15589 / NCIMB 2235) TaxID=288705 RepID=A9WRE8_RENSM|nr:oligopeptide-binding protein [Renibacterium salmoninarum ATCC 33209]
MSTAATYFGDDTTIAAFTQSFQAQMKAIGVEVAIDSQPVAAFADYMGQKKFSTAYSGNGVGADATSGLAQLFNSQNPGNATGAGTAQIDELIKQVPAIADKEARMAAANEVEKEFSKLYAILPVYNGPNIFAVKKGLANWGPELFALRGWTVVGWEKGSARN